MTEKTSQQEGGNAGTVSGTLQRESGKEPGRISGTAQQEGYGTGISPVTSQPEIPTGETQAEIPGTGSILPDGTEATGMQPTGSGAGEAVDTRMVRFLKRHHVLTLATADEGMPYCSNAFYCYDAERNLLIFTSDMTTRHAQQMQRNPHVAASVVLETKVVGRVRGLQLCGTAERADEAARRAYLRRFPYAALAELTLWAITPGFMKFTDNTLGFGKKLIWNDK